MPAKSEAQRRLMGMALAAKRGKIPESAVHEKSVLRMSESELEDFARKVSSEKARKGRRRKK